MPSSTINIRNIKDKRTISRKPSISRIKEIPMKAHRRKPVTETKKPVTKRIMEKPKVSRRKPNTQNTTQNSTARKSIPIKKSVNEKVPATVVPPVINRKKPIIGDIIPSKVRKQSIVQHTEKRPISRKKAISDSIAQSTRIIKTKPVVVEVNKKVPISKPNQGTTPKAGYVPLNVARKPITKKITPVLTKKPINITHIKQEVDALKVKQDVKPFSSDTKFMAGYVKILEESLITFSESDFRKLKKIVELLHANKKQDLIKQLYDDLEGTLKQMSIYLSVTKKEIVDELHKSLMSPEPSLQKEIKSFNLESLQNLQGNITPEVRTELRDFYNAAFYKMHKQLKFK